MSLILYWLLPALFFAITTLFTWKKLLQKDAYNEFIDKIDIRDISVFAFTTIIYPLNIYMTLYNIAHILIGDFYIKEKIIEVVKQILIQK